MTHARVRHVVGCMTGTSIDALDVALVRIEGEGLSMRAEFVQGLSEPLGALEGPLRALATQQPVTAHVIAHTMRDFALLHARAVRRLLDTARCTPSCSLISAHGQTVFHAPPVSWQLFQPAQLTADIGIDVVCDLRQADLAHGGQGAPITPLADWVLLHTVAPSCSVVNLGGFANYTGWHGGVETVSGADICACNQLLDALARDRLRQAFDANGAHALRGRAEPTSLRALLHLLDAQRTGGRSLGTGDELASWIARCHTLTPEDALRTACIGIARTIASSLRGAQGDVLLAGGGVRNETLAREIASEVGRPVRDVSSLGPPAHFREAACFAVLGALCQDGVPITLPAVTGVRSPAPRAGVWAYARA